MSRFANVSDEELRNLVKEKDAKRTQKASDQSWRTFESYCKEKSIVFDINTVSKHELNNILKTFYLEVRKRDGQLYQEKLFQLFAPRNYSKNQRFS